MPYFTFSEPGLSTGFPSAAEKMKWGAFKWYGAAAFSNDGRDSALDKPVWKIYNFTQWNHIIKEGLPYGNKGS